MLVGQGEETTGNGARRGVFGFLQLSWPGAVTAGTGLTALEGHPEVKAVLHRQTERSTAQDRRRCLGNCWDPIGRPCHSIAPAVKAGKVAFLLGC